MSEFRNLLVACAVVAILAGSTLGGTPASAEKGRPEVTSFQWLNPFFGPGTVLAPGCTGGDLVVTSGIVADGQAWDIPVLGLIPSAPESMVLFDITQRAFQDGSVLFTFIITNAGTVLDTGTGESFSVRATGGGRLWGNNQQFALDLDAGIPTLLTGEFGSFIVVTHHFHWTIYQDGTAVFFDVHPRNYECVRLAS